MEKRRRKSELLPSVKEEPRGAGETQADATKRRLKDIKRIILKGPLLSIKYMLRGLDQAYVVNTGRGVKRFQIPVEELTSRPLSDMPLGTKRVLTPIAELPGASATADGRTFRSTIVMPRRV